jgi:lysophospholipase L1-like esterase
MFRSQLIRSKPFRAVALGVAALLMVEAGLQLRAQLRFGQSVFAAALGQSATVHDPEINLRLFRPNIVISGTQERIETNSFGLRSPEIPRHREPSEARLALVGASTVMGAYARTNDDTASQILARLLRARYPDHTTNVINAGMAGNGMAAHAVMVERVVLPLNPQVVILMPGLNDISCRSASEKENETTGGKVLPQFSLPRWLLTWELITKNTVWLRDRDIPDAAADDTIISVDTDLYLRELERIVAMAREHGVTLVLATNARAFRREMPVEQQMALSASARHVYGCFTVADLHDLHEQHNGIIREVAEKAGLPLVDLEHAIPGGAEYFADATHFTHQGEESAAAAILEVLRERKILTFLYHESQPST